MKFAKLNPRHFEEIKQLFTKTFSDSEGQSEGELVGNLAFEIITSTANHEFFCFVVAENEKIIGSIIFSKLSFERSKIKAFLLSPVAISTNYQGKGLGQKLISFGLNELKENGVELVITYGDPNFYSRVGFYAITENIVKAPLKLSMPQGWLGQSLVSDEIEPISGDTYCIEAFNKPDIW